MLQFFPRRVISLSVVFVFLIKISPACPAEQQTTLGDFPAENFQALRICRMGSRVYMNGVKGWKSASQEFVTLK